MRKLLFIIALVCLFSCEKEQYHCYRCETKAKDFNRIVTTCEMTPSEAKYFQRGLQIQAMEFTGNPAVTICEITQCLK